VAESNNRIERVHGTEKELVKVTRAFDTDGCAAMIADGFRWKAILNAAITRSVTAAAESSGQVRSPD